MDRNFSQEITFGRVDVKHLLHLRQPRTVKGDRVFGARPEAIRVWCIGHGGGGVVTAVDVGVAIFYLGEGMSDDSGRAVKNIVRLAALVIHYRLTGPERYGYDCSWIKRIAEIVGGLVGVRNVQRFRGRIKQIPWFGRCHCVTAVWQTREDVVASGI